MLSKVPAASEKSEWHQKTKESAVAPGSFIITSIPLKGSIS